MRHGARNDIPAEVTDIRTGGMMAVVTVKLEGTEYGMASVMTVDSLQALELKVGDTVRVIAKAVDVLLLKP